MIKIFIGHDLREDKAIRVLTDSIFKLSSHPVSFTYIKNDQIKVYKREYANQSVDFTYSRFLVPYLCDYEGWAIFMDCDMLVREDITKLWDMRDENYAVQVVKHNYITKVKFKHEGEKQTSYPKKNWSSLMIFNCEKCKSLTPNFINTATGKQLHQFEWIDDEEIGSLPFTWNWLADEYEYKSDVANIHYTLGGPWFNDAFRSDYEKEWIYYHKKMGE